MITEHFTIEKREAQEFEPIPNNVYQVEITDIEAKKAPTFDTKNKPDAEKIYEWILNFTFTLLAGKADGKDLRGRNVWANFIPSYLYISRKNGKNALYQIIEAVKGREMTQEEEAYLDTKFINDLVGSQLRLVTKNVEKDGKTRTNIDSYLAAETEYAPLTPDEREKAKGKGGNKEPDTSKPDDDDVMPDFGTPDVNPGVVTEGL